MAAPEPSRRSEGTANITNSLSVGSGTQYYYLGGSGRLSAATEYVDGGASHASGGRGKHRHPTLGRRHRYRNLQFLRGRAVGKLRVHRLLSATRRHVHAQWRIEHRRHASSRLQHFRHRVLHTRRFRSVVGYRGICRRRRNRHLDADRRNQYRRHALAGPFYLCQAPAIFPGGPTTSAAPAS